MNKLYSSYLTNKYLQISFLVVAISYLFYLLPVFLFVPLLSLSISCWLLTSSFSKRYCFLIFFFLFILLSLLNLFAEQSTIYNSPPGDFQAYYTHSLDLNPDFSTTATSPVSTLWLTEPVIRIFYYLSSLFVQENLYLVSISCFLVSSYLYICYQLAPTKNHFVILSFFTFGLKAPFIVQGIWLVRQDISWLFFWIYVSSFNHKIIRFVTFPLSLLSHNSIVAMFFVVFATKPFRAILESVSNFKFQYRLKVSWKVLFISAIYVFLLSSLFYLAYGIVVARGSLETNTLIETSPPLFVYIYSFFACLVFFYENSVRIINSKCFADLNWALLVSTAFGIILLPFGGILSMRQASGVVMFGPMFLLSLSMIYLSHFTNLRFIYNLLVCCVFIFTFVRFCVNLYNPSAYQLYLVPITHSSLFNLLLQ